MGRGRGKGGGRRGSWGCGCVARIYGLRAGIALVWDWSGDEHCCMCAFLFILLMMPGLWRLKKKMKK